MEKAKVGALKAQVDISMYMLYGDHAYHRSKCRPVRYRTPV